MTLTDEEMWRGACGGDHECFGVLYDRYASRVYGYLLRRTVSWSDAEDLTSAVFLLAWHKRDQVVFDRASALPWLLGVARRVLANQRRMAARYRDAVAKLTREDMPDHAESVAQRLDAEREAAALKEQIRRLPRQQREVVELCLWTGLDQHAAAAVLGVAVGTVKSRLSRARSRLAASAAAVGPGATAHATKLEGSS
jgi:RNA polymerase sigma factor (sigma-70 family)